MCLQNTDAPRGYIIPNEEFQKDFCNFVHDNLTIQLRQNHKMW